MTNTRFDKFDRFVRFVGFGPRAFALGLGPAALGLIAVLHAQAPLPSHLWKDVTAETIGTTAGWTNKVEIADLNGDGRPDLLFANGGNYSDPGKPEMNGAFFNDGPGQARSTNRSTDVFGRRRTSRA